MARLTMRLQLQWQLTVSLIMCEKCFQYTITIDKFVCCMLSIFTKCTRNAEIQNNKKSFLSFLCVCFLLL